MEFTIYHNPQWGKSRKSLELLRKNGINPLIVEYLKEPLESNELISISKKLKMSPVNFVRKNDAKYKELNIDETSISDAEMFQTIVDHPRILERPIIISGDNAVIGRPPENILDLFQK